MMIIDPHENIAFNTKFFVGYRIKNRVIEDENGIIGYASYILAKHSYDGGETILCGYYMDKYDGAEDILNLKIKNTFDDIMKAIDDGEKLYYVYSSNPAIKSLKYSDRYFAVSGDFKW